jgi:hypothetical protein
VRAVGSNLGNPAVLGGLRALSGQPGKRIGGSAYRRIGAWGSKTAFRHGDRGQERSKKSTRPTRRYGDTFPQSARLNPNSEIWESFSSSSS